MDTPASAPLVEETAALREAYAALNRNDCPGFVQVCDPRIERIEPTGFPGAGAYQGREAVLAHLILHRGNWAEGSCEPERFIVACERIVVLLHVHVRLKHETEWREGHLADVFTFRDGKAVQWCSFAEERQAFAWADVPG